MSTQRLGRNQRAVCDLMQRHGGIYPYPPRYSDLRILQTLERRRIVSVCDGTWRLEVLW